jgi:stage V sporulation protein D (sporulation-specific penicillin-binding protein)
MEYVVAKGGGKKAQIKGVRVGGKTGTAQKKSATSSKYTGRIASFCGIAPVNDPQLTILYIVDEPEGDVYGSDVAAPAAQKVMKKTLRYMQTREND